MNQGFLSVIVPIFNEGSHLKENIHLLLSEVEPYFTHYEVILISDGSTDETNRILREFNHPQIRSIVLEKNRGKGNAIRQGFYEGKGDFILFIDGGMELHPREIRIFIGLMNLYDADIVIGSKRHPQSEIQYPLIRRILSFGYQMLIKNFFGLDVTDTQVGLKLFRKKVVEAIRGDLSIDRYGFDLEILALARARGFTKMLEAPVRLDYFSKNTRAFLFEGFHLLRVTWDVFRDTVRVYRKVRKLKKPLNSHPLSEPKES